MRHAAVFILSAISTISLLPQPADAVQNVILSWHPSSSVDVVGYNIHYGLQSRDWTVTVPAGLNTQETISGLVEGTTYYFVVTGYTASGVESQPSNEAAYAVPLSVPGGPGSRPAPPRTPITTRTRRSGASASALVITQRALASAPAAAADSLPAGPTLAIVTPTADQKLTNALADVRGTAAGDVSGVWYQLNGSDWKLAATTNGWADWNTTLPLAGGTNLIKAYAMDWDGNCSATNTISAFSKDAFKLRLDLDPAAASHGSPILTLERSANLCGRIECSTNLVDWTPLTNFEGNGDLTFYDSSAAQSPHRYYRAVIP